MSEQLLRPVQHAPEPREAYLEWQEQAACRTVDPEIFFPEKGGSYTKASKICNLCPVLEQCRRWGDDVESRIQSSAALYGMLADEIPAERVTRRRRERGAA